MLADLPKGLIAMGCEGMQQDISNLQAGFWFHCCTLTQWHTPLSVATRLSKPCGVCLAAPVQVCHGGIAAADATDSCTVAVAATAAADAAAVTAGPATIPKNFYSSMTGSLM